MRWDNLRVKRERRYYARLELKRTWQPWFAWYPVRVGEKTVWLEKLERKYWSIGYYQGQDQGYDYRLPGDVK
ncbi:MAG: hypothetical protein L0Y56_01680 [Nitrospira sp.]|nr:hypothetical protein [Nitrospira sp.]